jgi:hypothetical protein
MAIGHRSQSFVDVVTDLLSRGFRVRFRAEGVSMYPTIRAGETITVAPAAEVRLGDIALYRAERGLIAHRVVGIRRANDTASVFLARGEARGSGEEAVEERDVLGKVLTVERNGQAIDLGSRWAKIRRRVRKVLLFVAAFVAMFANTVRANIAVTASVSVSANSGNNCTISGLDASTGAPNWILVSISGTNANSFGTPTTTNLGSPTVALITSTVSTGARLAIWRVTGFTQNTGASITITTSGASGWVCGAVALSGVSGLAGPVPTVTGASTLASTTVTSPGPGGIVFDTMSTAIAAGAAPGGSQVQQWQVQTSSGRVGAASVSSPTTSMSWVLTAPGPVAWAIAAVPLNAASTTAVQPTSFAVTQHADRNLIELTTGREVSSLGFNLYREQNGTRFRLNASLLAGTALLAGSTTVLTAGHVHSWWDDPSADSSTASYWVEEVDLHGRRTWHGPATPKPSQETREEGRAVFLSQVGRADAKSGRRGDAGSHPLQARATSTRDVSSNTMTQYATQWVLAAGHAVKIGVRSEGWYQVALPDLVAAGFDTNAAATTLQLYAEGVQQPIFVQGTVGNRLGPQGTIQFYGTGLDTTWSDTRVYWLTWGNGSGRRMPAATVDPSTTAGPSNFPFTVEWKPRTVYFAALVNGDADNFFGPVLTSSEPVGQAITVTHLDPNSMEAAQLQITLQGASMAPHSVGVALNGSPVGTVTFSNQTAGVATVAVPIAVLQEGPNDLTLTVQGGDADVSVVDTVQLTYPHRYTADGDTLRFTAPGGQAETIGGFSSAQILVADITNPAAVTLVHGAVTPQAGSYAVTVVPPGAGTRTLLALTTAQAAKPATITAHHPSSWHAAQTGSDMVMISHADFVESLAPLVTVHQAEGRHVAVIDVQDLYDEFNFGEKSPYALKAFLITALLQWQLKPHFVLLAGDATYDPRNYLGVGDFDFVPTYLVGTQLLETASDDWFADFSGQGLPWMAIGRLPVRTPQDAAAQVSRIVNYDQAGAASWKAQVLLVADHNDSENNFEENAAAVKALLPSGLIVSEIVSQGSPGDNATLLNSLNAQGQGMVNFIGHGSEATWAGGLFSSTDAAGLTNGSMVPFVVSMTCLNGYFQDVYGTALAKALMNAPGGGAVAVWASSGLTNSAPQATMNQALIRALFGAQLMTLGEAAAAAKRAVSDLDVRRTWILFGDPAIRLQQ